MFNPETIVPALRSQPRSLLVTEEHIQNFATAIGDLNPLYHEPEFARAHGYRSLIAPPTFATVFGFNRIPGLAIPLAPLELPPPGIIYLDQEFRYYLSIVAGDTITTQGWVTRLKIREGSGLTTLYLASEGMNQQQMRVFEASASFLIPRSEEEQP
jgi:acyl dehydratase